MEKAVKEYIIKSVFPYSLCDVKVELNHRGNGFKVGQYSALTSSVFENLSKISLYLKKHHVAWYVSMYMFSTGKLGEIPCICFFDDEED